MVGELFDRFKESTLCLSPIPASSANSVIVFLAVGAGSWPWRQQLWGRSQLFVSQILTLRLPPEGKKSIFLWGLVNDLSVGGGWVERGFLALPVFSSLLLP